MRILAVKSDEQGTECIDPGQSVFAGKASPVDLSVEEAFAPAFRRFAVTLVLSNVGNDPMIETDLARLTGIKGTVGVEECAGEGQPQALHALESGLELGLEVEGIVVITCNNARRSDNVIIRRQDRQDVTGLGAFAPLIRHALASFLGQGMTAIQVQLAPIKLALHGLNTRLPHFFQAPVGTPFAKMVVHRLPTDLFFVASSGSGAIGNWSHWQPVCSRYRR
jgi:hypothetical protein